MQANLNPLLERVLASQGGPRPVSPLSSPEVRKAVLQLVRAAITEDDRGRAIRAHVRNIIDAAEDLSSLLKPKEGETRP